MSGNGSTTMNANTPETSEYRITGRDLVAVGVGSALFLALIVYWSIIDFAVNRSDTAEYLKWSQLILQPEQWNWRTTTAHVPGYPVAIAIARTLTLGLIDDLYLAHVIVYFSWLVSIYYFSRLVFELCPEARAPCVLCFALYPFIGVVHGAMCGADVPAFAMFMAAAYYAHQNKWWHVVIFGALAMVTHHGMWLCMLVLALVCCWKYGMKWYHFILSGTALVAYWAVVAVYRRDLFLKVMYVDAEFMTQSTLKTKTVRTLPVFDAILGTMLDGSPNELIQGSLLLGVFILALIVLVHHIRARNWYLIALTIPTIFLSIILNQMWAWGIMRFSRPFLIPAGVWLLCHPRILRFANNWRVYSLAALLLAGTQIAFAVYVVNYYTHHLDR